jgi:hypothetical protein
MKYESMMLKMLFVATLALSAGLFASMLFTPHDAVRLADPAGGASEAPTSMSLQHMACPLAPDGVICLRAG